MCDVCVAFVGFVYVCEPLVYVCVRVCMLVYVCVGLCVIVYASVCACICV